MFTQVMFDLWLWLFKPAVIDFQTSLTLANLLLLALFFGLSQLLREIFGTLASKCSTMFTDTSIYCLVLGKLSIQSRLWVLRATRNETVKLRAIKPKQRAGRDWNLVERIDTKGQKSLNFKKRCFIHAPDSGAAAFVLSLLEPDPAKRPSVRAAMEERWINEGYAKKPLHALSHKNR